MRARLSGLALVCVLFVAGGSVQASCAPVQAALQSAESLIRGAEADIRSAQGSAGTAARPAKGSRRKLTEMRLDSARQRLAKAAQLLGKYPASHAGAASLRKRQAAALKAITQIQAILDPGSASTGKKPAPVSKDGGKKPVTGSGNGGTANGGAAGGAKARRLDYKQEKLLKDSRWYLRETQKYLKPATATLARLDGTGPKPVVAEVQGALASVGRAIPKYNLAVENIGQLPANHPDVAKVRKQIQELGQTLGAVKSRLQAESKRLQKLTGLASYPTYKKDFELLGAFSQRYGNLEMLKQQPEKLAQIIQEDANTIKEIQRIAKTYQTLADQKTPEGKSMAKRVLYVVGRRKTFARDLMAYKQTLPKAIERDLSEALRIAKEGVEKKRPLYFGENSGIAQQLGFAEKKILVLRAFSDAEARPWVEKMAAARKQIARSAKALQADIIANNQLPPDRYQDKDRAALIRLATETWAKEQKGAKVLAARIPSKAWARTTRWQWSSGAFRKVDYSKLQVQLIVQHDDKLAVVRPVNLFKDHLKGDTLTAAPFHKMSDELQPQSLLLLTKIR